MNDKNVYDQIIINGLTILAALAVLWGFVLYPLWKRGIHPLGVYLGGYRWHDGVIIHQTTLKQLTLLEKEVAQLKRINSDIHAGKIKAKKIDAKHTQYTFDLGEKSNGHKIRVPYPVVNPATLEKETYHFVFNTQEDWEKFKHSETWRWIERKTKSRDGRFTFRKMWIETKDFNPSTDIDILAYWPNVEPKHLPFEIEEVS